MSIEGAFIKSLAYNGNVAIVDTKFGYTSETTFKNIVLKLPEDPSAAAVLVENYFDNYVDKKLDGKKWLNDFYSSNKTNNVFNAIDLIS